MKRYISLFAMLIVAGTFVIGTSAADDTARGDDQGAVRTLLKNLKAKIGESKDWGDGQPVRDTVERVSDAVKGVGENEPVRSAVEKVAKIAKRDGDREPLKKLTNALKDAVKRDGGRK